MKIPEPTAAEVKEVRERYGMGQHHARQFCKERSIEICIEYIKSWDDVKVVLRAMLEASRLKP
jgi:hypothetical protein